MFGHALKVIYRNFFRFKSAFAINIVGLSTGLAGTILIYLWINDELSVDRFHENQENLYQVMANHDVTDGIMTWEATPDLLAETMAEEIPEIRYAAATVDVQNWLGVFSLTKYNEKYKASGQFVGSDFFNLFSFPLIKGDKQQLLVNKNSIVISKELALKLFNSVDDAIGKVVEWQLQNWKGQHTVTGVLQDLPVNSTIQFDFVLPFESFKDISNQMGRTLHWDNHGPSTYVLLENGTDPLLANEKIADFIKQKDQNSVITLFIQPFHQRYLYGKYQNGKQSGGRIMYVKLVALVGLFILVIACINFMNLSTAKASSRLKEVGVKKTIGASRKSLVWQFMGETFLLTFLSLIVAILLVSLLVPQFNEITGKQLIFTLNAQEILWFSGIAGITGFISGSYPALFLSSFSPASVIKGKLNKSVGELWIRKGLVIFQFAMSVLLIISVVVVYNQLQFIQSQNLGYNKDNLVYFQKEGNLADNAEAFLNEARNLPGVTKLAGISAPLIGSNATTFGVNWSGKNPEDDINFEQVDVDYGLIETLDIQMKAGRSFSEDFKADSNKIIFNETAIRVMGLENPIGSSVNVWGTDYEIIGVVEDFHFESFHVKVNPLFMFLRPQRARVFMARIQAGKERETIDQLDHLYSRFNPGYPFTYHFLDETYQAQYQAEQRVATLAKYFAGWAILISCLGLFGLTAYTVERRTKEIGIRKILGSGYLRIISLLSIDFTKMVLISILIALPVGIILSQNWLDGFAYRVQLQWWFFLLPALSALLIAWLTVGLNTIKAAYTNPLQSLRDE